jgi:chemotaxis protein methyltransferase CheR
MTASRAAASDAAAWSLLRTYVRRWTGIVLGPRDQQPALHALAGLAAAAGLPAAQYLSRLDTPAHAPARQPLIERLAIGTTWFLREPAGLGALVAALVQEYGVGSQVRLWSAGCSTGQEPYGLAMALCEAGLRPRILATDINQEALRTAAAACYPTRALGGLPAAWQERYTVAESGDQVRLRPSLTALVRFAEHNLVTSTLPPPGWEAVDAVVCRNVLLYFDRAQAVEVVRGLSACCRPGGYVLLSAAEQPLAWMTDALSPYAQKTDAVLLRRPPPRCRPAPAAPPLPRPRTLAPVPARPPDAPVRERLQAASALIESGAAVPALRLLDELLADDPLLAAAHLLRGLLLKRSGALLDAVAALRCARFLYGDEAWLPPYHLALVLEQLGEPAEAGEAYRHALAAAIAGGRSGLLMWEAAEEALVHTVAEACRARLAALGTVPSSKGARPTS